MDNITRWKWKCSQGPRYCFYYRRLGRFEVRIYPNPRSENIYKVDIYDRSGAGPAIDSTIVKGILRQVKAGTTRILKRHNQSYLEQQLEKRFQW